MPGRHVEVHRIADIQADPRSHRSVLRGREETNGFEVGFRVWCFIQVTADCQSSLIRPWRFQVRPDLNKAGNRFGSRRICRFHDHGKQAFSAEKTYEFEG